MSTDDRYDESARMEIVRFLAGTLYEPEAFFIEEDLFGSIVLSAQNISKDLGALAKELEKAFIEDAYEENQLNMQRLLVDYSRLFLGPPSPLASPYYTSWVEDKTDALAGLLHFYADAGLEIDEDFHDQPDHAAVILEMLYVLKSQSSAQCHSFVEQYVNSWMSHWAKTLEQEAQTKTYRTLGVFFQRWLLAQSVLPK